MTTPPCADLRAYLVEIRPALEPIIERLWTEHRQVQELSATIAQATRDLSVGYQYVEQGRLLDEDDGGLATAVYWDTYFGPDKLQHDARIEREALEQQLAAHSEKRAIESAALLQNAKQCVSLVHGRSREKAPVGRRLIAGEPLRNIVWEGRNQSLHWEEGAFSQSVHDAFANLRNAFPGHFDDYLTRNKAFEVVDVLGWKRWSAFYDDVASFA